MKKLLTLFTITVLSSITVPTTANAIINHNNLINPTIDNKTDSNPELIGQLTFSQKNMKMGFEGIVENNNLFYGVMIKNQSISFYTINNKVGSSFTLVKRLLQKEFYYKIALLQH